ncbi:MAG: hypothetical protein MZV70_40340 [Desulfobacterales bacterium]|nr:hypothetical protein [Desulfobacterales bacterium]
METILIVDDEKNYLLVLSAVLEEEGYEVLTAPGGLEALEIHKASDARPGAHRHEDAGHGRHRAPRSASRPTTRTCR